MGLPASGIISSSQVGVYVFDRANTDEFSLSASLAGTTVDKGYPTTLGPLWRGTGVSDVDNHQYGAGANNFSLGDWYNYFKGFTATLAYPYLQTEDACAEQSEFSFVYYTAGDYFNAGPATTIYANNTVAYDNTSGTSPFGYDPEYYFKVYEDNTVYRFDNNGVFVDAFNC